MKGYIANIEGLSLENNNFRTVLYTAKHNHRDGTVRATKADAEADIADEFDGTTTE